MSIAPTSGTVTTTTAYQNTTLSRVENLIGRLYFINEILRNPTSFSCGSIVAMTGFTLGMSSPLGLACMALGGRHLYNLLAQAPENSLTGIINGIEADAFAIQTSQQELVAITDAMTKTMDRLGEQLVATKELITTITQMAHDAHHNINQELPVIILLQRTADEHLTMSMDCSTHAGSLHTQIMNLRRSTIESLNRHVHSLRSSLSNEQPKRLAEIANSLQSGLTELQQAEIHELELSKCIQQSTACTASAQEAFTALTMKQTELLRSLRQTLNDFREKATLALTHTTFARRDVCLLREQQTMLLSTLEMQQNLLNHLFQGTEQARTEIQYYISMRQATVLALATGVSVGTLGLSLVTSFGVGFVTSKIGNLYTKTTSLLGKLRTSRENPLQTQSFGKEEAMQVIVTFGPTKGVSALLLSSPTCSDTQGTCTLQGLCPGDLPFNLNDKFPINIKNIAEWLNKNIRAINHLDVRDRQLHAMNLRETWRQLTTLELTRPTSSKRISLINQTDEQFQLLTNLMMQTTETILRLAEMHQQSEGEIPSRVEVLPDDYDAVAEGWEIIQPPHTNNPNE